MINQAAPEPVLSGRAATTTDADPRVKLWAAAADTAITTPAIARVTATNAMKTTLTSHSPMRKG
jgi:hypothetical protein